MMTKGELDKAGSSIDQLSALFESQRTSFLDRSSS